VTHAPRIVVSPDDPVFDVADTDPTVAPIEDFYRFANGGWIDANPVPAEYGAWGAAQEVHERNQAILRDLMEKAAADTDVAPDTPESVVGIYYRSGMDTGRIEDLGVDPIQGWLDRIDALSDPSRLTSLLSEMHQHGVGALFGIGVLPDFEDATANLLYLGQGGLGLPDRDYYFREDEASRALREAYRSHIARMFELLGRPTGPAATAADVVLEFETAIAEFSYTNVQMRDIELITNKHPMSSTAALMPTFDLHGYLETIGVGGEAAVNIDNEGFFPGLDSLISRTPIDHVRTYLTWHLLLASASSLPERFEREAFDFYGRTLSGQQEQKARWKRVLAAGTADIGELISQLFVKDNFPPEAKASMEHLVDRLLEAMRTTIETLAWMGDDTKAEALEKLSAFGYKIGYPDEWRDYTALHLVEGAWLENRFAARAFEFRRQLSQLGEPVDPNEWSIAPHVVNAYYHPLRNEIVFPAGILQPPFFTAGADDAVNYGAIGAVIGHEITHGFDDQGSRFDAAGNVRNWWSEEDRAEFDRRAEVMADQFSAYEIEDGLNVNGELTLGENIADLGGLKIALRALETELDGDVGEVAGLTARQRFFISWARIWRRNYTPEYQRLLVNSDPHAPSDLRCTGPMSNMTSFADAFDIPHDHASMRPLTDRVDIW
jgi:putative endopeptidase